MEKRNSPEQSLHDIIVEHLALELFNKGFQGYKNPDGEKNYSHNGRYFDIIFFKPINPWGALVMEVETESSVTQAEASNQWIDYSKNSNTWWLVVPDSCEKRTQELLSKNDIENCKVITWHYMNDKVYFSTLPPI